LPNNGIVTAKAIDGAICTHATVLVFVCRSVRMTSSDADSRVVGKDDADTPIMVTHKT
jgi:hypothetical protein